MIARLMPVIILLALLGLSHSLAYWSGQSSEQQRWQLAEATRQRDTAAANLAAYQTEAERLHGLAVRLESKIETLAAIRPKLVERYTHEKTINPLATDCSLDVARLRIINDAIAVANTASAGGPEQALPADHAAGQR